MNTSSSPLARLYELLDRVSALEAEMQSGGWSHHMVSARHDAIRLLVEACQDQISMPPRRRAKFGRVPYLDLTANNNQEIEHG